MRHDKNVKEQKSISRLLDIAVVNSNRKSHATNCRRCSDAKHFLYSFALKTDGQVLLTWHNNYLWKMVARLCEGHCIKATSMDNIQKRKLLLTKRHKSQD